MSSSEGRSTLDLQKSQIPIVSTEDLSEKLETQELEQIDSIPTKTSEEKPKEEEKVQEPSDCSPGTRSTLKQLLLEDIEDTVEIFLPATEEDTLDQDLDNFIQEYLKTNSIETRTVKLNNAWRITDSIGNPDFPELLKEDPNFDLLTFITEKMPF